MLDVPAAEVVAVPATAVVWAAARLTPATRTAAVKRILTIGIGLERRYFFEICEANVMKKVQ